MILAGGPSDATEISAEDAAGFATGNASLAEARQRARATASD
jgi:alkanesulfonate monooxygenase SsuD/methylene tetrahydromethanopterin reductase-like flavin-dependent oxidoreductase (luciferase family)